MIIIIIVYYNYCYDEIRTYIPFGYIWITLDKFVNCWQGLHNQCWEQRNTYLVIIWHALFARFLINSRGETIHKIKTWSYIEIFLIQYILNMTKIVFPEYMLEVSISS